MIGKVLAALAGKRAARHVSGVGGTGGALLGIGAATLARRLGPIGLVAATLGGLFLKRRLDKRAARGVPQRADFQT